MARRKATAEVPLPRASKKRDLPVDPYEVPDEADTPRRRRRVESNTETNSAIEDDWNGNHAANPQSAAELTPAKRRGRPLKSAATGTPKQQATTPSARRQRPLAETPAKTNGIGTPSRRSIADRSARRKSARALIDRVIGGAISDDEVEEGDIAREIYESSEDEEVEADGQEHQDGVQEPETPSKTPGRKRRAAVLDKDDCFATPDHNEVYAAYKVFTSNCHALRSFCITFL